MKINLSNIKPGVMVKDPAKDIGELLQHFFSLIQFVPVVRFAIGWRGMAPSKRFRHSWTFKIKGFKGVFGLCFANAEKCTVWAKATFQVYYFPDPDEPLVERFSLAAIYHSQQQDYSEQCREFLAYPEMAQLFEVGKISLAINEVESSIVLSLNALSRHKITSRDGIALAASSPSNFIVAPNEIDQNLPSFVIAYGLFKVIAATVTFSLQQSPSNLLRERRRGCVYSASAGGISLCINDAVDDINLSLSYGDSDMSVLVQASGSQGAARSALMWSEGQVYPAIMSQAFWWCAHKINDLKAYDKRLMGIEERPPLYIISGFLGSGKTSLLQHLLEYEVQRGRFVAVLQNEMGQVSLDGRLMDQSYSVTELNEGTVCCSLAGELRTALDQITTRFQPDVIVLETSGATNPLYLREDLVPLSEIVRLDSITVVVDAAQYQAIEQYEVISDQINAADIIIINKVDKIADDVLQDIVTDLSTRNPKAKVYPTTQGYVNPRVIYPTESEDSVQPRSVSQNIGHHKHHHHRKHHHDQLASVKIPFDHAVCRQDLVRTLETLPSSVFRLKGIVTVEHESAVLVQYVAGDYQIEAFRSAVPEEHFLVAIGKDLSSAQRQLDQLAAH